MHTEHVRRAVFDSLSRALGEPEAQAVMEVLGKVERIMLAQEGGAAALRGDMAELRGETRALAFELRGEMASLASELRGEMGGLRGEMVGLRGEMAGLRGDMAELRGDMAELRGEVKSHLPKLIAANIASMAGLLGVAIAAAQLV